MHVGVPSLPAAYMELQKLLALVDSEGHRGAPRNDAEWIRQPSGRWQIKLLCT